MISIIIPIYKSEAYLHRCIDSILGQTFQNFEIILVNDGSPDNCGEICEEYAKQDHRIHVLHQKNAGQASARNRGLDWLYQNSESEWLAFIDSDDWIHKEYLEILLKMAIQSNTKVSMCDFVRRTSYCEDAALVGEQMEVTEFRRAYTEQYSMCMTPCAKIYHRVLWEKLRFPVGKIYEDAMVTHLPLMEAGTVSYCKDQLYYYYIGSESTTRGNWSVRRLDQLEAHELRMTCWKQAGFDDCYICELKAYTEALGVQIVQIVDQKTDTKVLNSLRKKLRRMLLIEKGYQFFPTGDAWCWLYSAAYPNKLQRTAIYLYLKMIKG